MTNATNALNLNTLKLNVLVSMVNELGGSATLKTFSQRSKAVERITKLADAQKVDLNSFFEADGTKRVAPVVEAPAAEKAPKKAKTPKEPKAPKEPKISIRSVAEALLVKVAENGEGLSYEEIVATVKEQFPAAKTTVGCLRWYAVRMREAGTVLPKRPRAKQAAAGEPTPPTPAVPAEAPTETPAAEPVVETPAEVAPAATEEVAAA